MNRNLPTEAVLTAVMTTLQATSAVTALATGGIYNNVPAGATYPYIEVSIPSVIPQDTVSRFGASILIVVKAVSQYRGDLEGIRILNACASALQYAHPTLTAPYSWLGCTWEASDPYPEVVNGITTRHHPGTFRIWAEQTS